MSSNAEELVSVAVGQLWSRGAERIIIERDRETGRTQIYLDTQEKLWSTERAAQYVGAKSTAAFYRWAKRWRVRNRGKGQWAQVDLDQGLERQRWAA